MNWGASSAIKPIAMPATPATFPSSESDERSNDPPCFIAGSAQSAGIQPASHSRKRLARPHQRRPWSRLVTPSG